MLAPGGQKINQGMRSLNKFEKKWIGLKSMEERGLIERKPNPNDGRSVLIHLTEFGKEKREYSRDRVLIFNETIRKNIAKEKIDHFYEVAHVINEMISNRKIYTNNQVEIKDEHKKN